MFCPGMEEKPQAWPSPPYTKQSAPVDLTQIFSRNHVQAFGLAADCYLPGTTAPGQTRLSAHRAGICKKDAAPYRRAHEISLDCCPAKQKTDKAWERLILTSICDVYCISRALLDALFFISFLAG